MTRKTDDNPPSWLYAYSPESDYAEPDDRLLPSGWWIGAVAWGIMFVVFAIAVGAVLW